MYARQVGDRTLTLGVSGNLWRDVLVLYDRETDSLWTQLSGKAIQGALAGRSLEEVPSEMTTWAEWKARYPHTVVLKKEAKGKSGSTYDSYATNRKMLGIFGTENRDDRLDGKEMVYGVKLDGAQALAVVAARLEAEGAVVVPVGRKRLLLSESPAGGVMAHLLPGGSAKKELLATSRGGGVWKLSNGSVVDTVAGKITGGPAKGKSLERLPVTRAYWFAWSAFYPHSDVIAAAGKP